MSYTRTEEQKKAQFKIPLGVFFIHQMGNVPRKLQLVWAPAEYIKDEKGTVTLAHKEGLALYGDKENNHYFVWLEHALNFITPYES